jgi:hypothetical protein
MEAAVHPTDEEKTIAAYRVVIQTRARVEIGHHGDWIPESHAWWASASLPGRRYFAQDQGSAADALLALAEQLLELGQCEKCHRQIQVLRTGQVYLGSGDAGIRPDTCLWSRLYTRRGGIQWVATC